jgi:hypothetical protein
MIDLDNRLPSIGGTFVHRSFPQLLLKWLKEIFILADKKNKGLLNETEILSLLQQLNVTAPARVVKPKFKVGSSNQIRLIHPLSTNHTRLIHPLSTNHTRLIHPHDQSVKLLVFRRNYIRCVHFV